MLSRSGCHRRPQCLPWVPRSSCPFEVCAQQLGQREGNVMRASSLTGTLFGSLLMASALTPVGAADMTYERALNVAKEPQNWLLHHGNYEGHRFSALKEINTDTVKNLKAVFSVALGGFESGGRYKFGNLEGTPLVENGMMYVTDGWG